MKSNHAYSAHSVLEYVITRAVLQGKVGETEIMLPLIHLVDSDEGITFDESARDLCLKVTIITEWSEGEEDLVMIDDEEGEIDGNKASGTNSTGH